MFNCSFNLTNCVLHEGRFSVSSRSEYKITHPIVTKSVIEMCSVSFFKNGKIEVNTNSVSGMCPFDEMSDRFFS